ncbi:MAG: LysR family transcriptional regulator [Sporolactobacillus sp.]|nr:LysR family transcriptional regulator [Sporolactobacillus sp.]
MKFEQLFYLKEAVKYHSISIAAEKNFMSQSSLSYAINHLERELGTNLLKRTNVGVTPTRTGEKVLKKSENIFKSIDEIVEIAKTKENSGEVHISCIPCICDWILPELLKTLDEQSTNIVLSVTTGESNQVVHDVSAGISELGILINYEELERNIDLRYTSLFHDEYVLYVGRHSPYWNRTNIDYAEMLKAPYIAYRDEFKRYNGGLTNMVGTSELPNIIFRTDNLDSIKNMIARNDYVAFFPRFMSENDLYVKSGWIRRVSISDKKMDFEVGCIESIRYRAKGTDRVLLNALLQMMQEIKT